MANTQVLTSPAEPTAQGIIKTWARKPDPSLIKTIDFSDFLSGDEKRVKFCLSELHEACVEHGFFQIINHPVSLETQKAILKASADFFTLPREEKAKLDQRQNDHNRGYQTLLSQKYKEEDTAPDLKEGYYVGPELSWDHPQVVAGKFAHGPNYWPESLGQDFQDVCMDYLEQLNFLSVEVLRAVSMSVDGNVEETNEFIKHFTEGPITYFKMNHYPKPPRMDDIGQKGHGEHKDFGFVTLLLQDGNPGLEVWDAPSESWIDVPPTEGAFVVNLGNLLERWTNSKYLSNVHRVLNFSGTDRHSIAHLYHGNPDYMIEAKKSCYDPAVGPEFGPIRIEDFVRGKYDEVYARAGVIPTEHKAH
ncbi:hypothetical protein BKA58DRAFT_443525 [Alternaria rosae]|uniref:uncharacterized protein n=1 Tax=Alternaria rosae TaxID=1187941 RepID=UPI001E8EB46E|nr:uncharacterized protein BKA58DRAFT_443525 [Alternaria rosae]KAH6860747.1 hypothetical protein BKA58DRAFT_443525 [Alternaria rosae]